MRTHNLLSAIAAVAFTTGAFVPTGASAGEPECEVSGGGTLAGGGTFILSNLVSDPFANVSPTPRPVVMFLSGGSPREHFNGVPELMLCRPNGVFLIDMEGMGRFRGVLAEFTLSAVDSPPPGVDTYTIEIFRAGTDELLFSASGDVVDGDIEGLIVD